MVIDIETHSEAVPERKRTPDKVTPETDKNLAANATGPKVKENPLLDESDLGSSAGVLVTPPEIEGKESSKPAPKSQQLGTAATARSVTTAKDEGKKPEAPTQTINTPVPEATSPTPVADAGGEGGGQPPEKPRGGAEEDGERPQPSAKKVHETLSAALAQSDERPGLYNQITTEVGDETVEIKSEHTYLAGPPRNVISEEAEDAHQRVLSEGKAIILAKFTCPEDETDDNDQPVASYTYITAPPAYLDTDIHEEELATFLGTTPEEVLEKNADFFNENRRVMTPNELQRAVNKPDADLLTPATFVRTTYRNPNQEEGLEVLEEDNPSQRAHQRRLSALERRFSRATATEESIQRKEQEKVGKELFLTPEEEERLNIDRRLIEGYRNGDQALAAQLVERHRGIVWEMVRSSFARYPTNRIDYEDGMQEGFLALFKATKTWDSSQGVPFINYAANQVAWALTTFLEDRSHQVRLGDRARSKLQAMRIANLIRQQEGKPPLTDEEVSELTGSPLVPEGGRITVADLRRAEALTTALGAVDDMGENYQPGGDIYESPKKVVSHQQHPRVTSLTGEHDVEDIAKDVTDKLLLIEVIERYLRMDAMGATRHMREEELRWLSKQAGAYEAPITLTEIARAAGISIRALPGRLERSRKHLKSQFIKGDPEA